MVKQSCCADGATVELHYLAQRCTPSECWYSHLRLISSQYTIQYIFIVFICHLQVVRHGTIAYIHSVAQICTCKDTLAHILGAPCLDDVMSYNLLTTLRQFCCSNFSGLQLLPSSWRLSRSLLVILVETDQGIRFVGMGWRLAEKKRNIFGIQIEV